MATWTAVIFEARLWQPSLPLSLQLSISSCFIVPSDFREPTNPPDISFWQAVWTRCPSTLQVTFDISFAYLDHPDPGNFVSQLADDLVAWKIWTELGFEATVTAAPQRTRYNDCRWQHIVQLRRIRLDSAKGSSRESFDCHLLDDHQQPRGIPVLTLRALRICLTLAPRGPPRKRRKLTEQQGDQDFESLLDIDHSAGENVSGITKHQSLVFDLPHVLPRDSQVSSSDEQMLLAEDDIAIRKPITYSSRTDHEPELLASAVRDVAIVSLVDAGIRRAIVSKPYRVARTIHCSVESGSPRLVHIAPCICCPRHLQASTERAPHFVSIAASLASISRRRQRRGRAKGFGSKLDDYHLTERQYTNTAIEGKIWTLMRRKAANPGHAQRLSPLQSPRTDANGVASKSFDALLLTEELRPHVLESFAMHDNDNGEADDTIILPSILDDVDLDGNDDLCPSSWDSGLGQDAYVDAEEDANLLDDTYDDSTFFPDSFHSEELLGV